LKDILALIGMGISMLLSMETTLATHRLEALKSKFSAKKIMIISLCGKGLSLWPEFGFWLGAKKEQGLGN